MTQSELIEKISVSTGQTKVATKIFLDTLGAEITEALKRGDNVVLPEIGKFEKVHHDARAGRNPSTGEALTINSHEAVKFKPLKVLRDRINNR